MADLMPVDAKTQKEIVATSGKRQRTDSTFNTTTTTTTTTSSRVIVTDDIEVKKSAIRQQMTGHLPSDWHTQLKTEKSPFTDGLVPSPTGGKRDPREVHREAVTKKGDEIVHKLVIYMQSQHEVREKLKKEAEKAQLQASAVKSS